MKTSVAKIRVPNRDEHGNILDGYHDVSIRSDDGNLKTNMLSKQLKTYGDAAKVPATLTLEILRSRMGLRADLRRANAENKRLAESLYEHQCCLGDMLDVLRFLTEVVGSTEAVAEIKEVAEALTYAEDYLAYWHDGEPDEKTSMDPHTVRAISRGEE